VTRNYTTNCSNATPSIRIAAMPLLPFGVTSLWHAFLVMRRCEAHRTMWRSPGV